MLAPPLPMMFLWNCLKMGTESEKLFSICREKKGEAVKLTIMVCETEMMKEAVGRTRSAMIFWRNLAHFSTSFLGPLSWTMSLFCDGSGKLIMTWRPIRSYSSNSIRTQWKLIILQWWRGEICYSKGQGKHLFTSGNLSRTSLIFSPFWPMIVRWNFCSTIRSLVRSFSWKQEKKSANISDHRTFCSLCTELYTNQQNEWMNQPKLWPYSHHSLDHLNEFSASQLDALRVSLDPDEATSLWVLGDSYRHFVLLLDPIDWWEGEPRRLGCIFKDKPPFFTQNLLRIKPSVGLKVALKSLKVGSSFVEHIGCVQLAFRQLKRNPIFTSFMVEKKVSKCY